MIKAFFKSLGAFLIDSTYFVFLVYLYKILPHNDVEIFWRETNIYANIFTIIFIILMGVIPYYKLSFNTIGNKIMKIDIYSKEFINENKNLKNKLDVLYTISHIFIKNLINYILRLTLLSFFKSLFLWIFKRKDKILKNYY